MCTDGHGPHWDEACAVLVGKHEIELLDKFVTPSSLLCEDEGHCADCHLGSEHRRQPRVREQPCQHIPRRCNEAQQATALHHLPIGQLLGSDAACLQSAKHCLGHRCIRIKAGLGEQRLHVVSLAIISVPVLIIASTATAGSTTTTAAAAVSIAQQDGRSQWCGKPRCCWQCRVRTQQRSAQP